MTGSPHSDHGVECASENSGRLTALVLAGTLAVLPWALLIPTDADRFLPLLLVPAFCLAARLPSSSGGAHTRAVGILAGFALLAAIVSALASPHTARAFATTSTFTGSAMTAFIAARLASRSDCLRILYIGIAIGAAVGVLVVQLDLFQNDFNFPLYRHRRIFGLHIFSGCIAALGWLVLSPGRGVWRWLAFTTTAVTWTGLAWSGGRAPLLALSVTIAAWFFFSPKAQRRSLMIWVPIISLIALLGASALGSKYAETGLWTALERTREAGDLTSLSSNRVAIWNTVIGKIQESPWIGHGADSYLFIRPGMDGEQPHNFILQWLLEFGVIGAVPLLAILMISLYAGLRKPTRVGESGNWIVLSAAGLAGACACALFDGVFYHPLIAMPFLLMLGFSHGSDASESTTTKKPGWPLPIQAAAGLSLAILLLHNWLFWMLQHGRPDSPQAMPARVMRHFPSITYGLWNWMETWRKTDPATALEWSKWAQSRAVNASYFHAYAAELYLRHGRFDEARAEIEAGLNTLHPRERKPLESVLLRINAAEAYANEKSRGEVQKP